MCQACLMVAALCLVGKHPGEVKVKAPRRVGEIYVVGNEVMCISAFLDRLGLYSGMLYTRADLEAAERRLACLRWQAGVRCRVTVKPSREDTEFQTIVVQVHESRFTRLAGPIHNTVSFYVGLLIETTLIDGPQLLNLLDCGFAYELE